MGSHRGRVVRAKTWSCFRLQQEHIQISVVNRCFSGRVYGLTALSKVGGLIYTQNVIDSIFLSDLKTVLTFVFNNKMTQV